MPSAVSYIRVSTGQQGKSGLGIEAQRTTIAAFAAAEGLTIAAEFIEVETGKGADALDRRPILREALAAAKRAKAPVIVAKLAYAAERNRKVALGGSMLSDPRSE